MSSNDFTSEVEGLDDELAAYNDAVAFAEMLEASSLGSPDAQAARWAGSEVLLEHRGPLPPHGRPSARCQPSTLSLARHVADHFDNRGLRDVGTLWRIVATAEVARPHASADAAPPVERAEAHGGENIPESERYVTIDASDTTDEALGLAHPPTSHSASRGKARVTDGHGSTHRKVWYYDRRSRCMHYSNPLGQSGAEILLCAPRRRLPGKPVGVNKRALVAGMVLAVLLVAIQHLGGLSFNSPTVPAVASGVQHKPQTSESGQFLGSKAASAPTVRLPLDKDSGVAGLGIAGSDTIVFGSRDFARPVNGRVTVIFGAGSGGIENGIEISIGVNASIYAVADSIVEESGPVSGFGMWVVLRHADGTRSVYGRINRSLVNVGDMVAAGEQIAEVGNRDTSTGPHLHFEIWDIEGMKIDPLAWLNERGIGY